MTSIQENRLLQIITDPWNERFVLRGFEGTEGLSTLFSFELDLVSENNNIAFDEIIGQNLTVAIARDSGGLRYFNGIVSRFSLEGDVGGDGGDGMTNYSATLVPWFWLLSRTSDSRIFQELSVPDIVERIFREKNFNDFRISVQGSYGPKEYYVQYQETDLNFISRILEQEGIYYFFTHKDGEHTMVLADSPNEHKPCPSQETARFHAVQGAALEEDVIRQIYKMQEIRIGKYVVNDFNFKTPATDLKVEVTTGQQLGPGEREIYDYPAEYMDRSEGDRLANIRMQMEEAKVTTLSGSGNCRSFASGYRFRLTGHYREDMTDQDFVLNTVAHAAYEPTGGSGEEEGGASYTNNFVCTPYDVPYRPPLVTPKPVITGVQTAIVTGPEGEEIYTDEHGRVKVQFHWDREGQRNEDSSCWIRVSQLWAGAGYGAIFIPRIGHEVIVDFIEGDPDRPIIVGRVYHGNNQTPYGLPAEKTKSTIKSESSPGGGGANEIRFEDKAGEEEVYIHAQYDRNDVVENDQSSVTHNNRTTTVDVDDTEEIGNNQTLSVGVNQNVDIGANQTISVGGAHKLDIGSNRTVTVGGSQSETVGGSQEVTIGGAQAVTIGGVQSVDVGGAISITGAASTTIMVGAGATITVGAGLTITAAAPVTITAPIITLNTGMVQVAGIVQCTTLMATSVVSSSYTPGAGNVL